MILKQHVFYSTLVLVLVPVPVPFVIHSTSLFEDATRELQLGRYLYCRLLLRTGQISYLWLCFATCGYETIMVPLQLNCNYNHNFSYEHNNDWP